MRIRALCAGVRWGLLLGIAVATATSAHADDAIGAARDARVRVISREELERAGYVTIADVLQRLPQSGAARSPMFNGFGDGTHRVDLRDLGDASTLVLVNGQRWVRTLDGGVDLTAIPFGAVDRVEIEYAGDGPRAGSGAIAGTINIVLLESYSGAEARAWTGESDEGDARTQHYDFTVGAATERASVVVDVSYDKQEPVLAGDRAISSVPFVGLDPHDVAQGASSTTPFGRFGGRGIPGTLVLRAGEDGRQRSDFRAFDSTIDGYNGAPDNYLLTPSERYGAYANLRYAVRDDVGFHATMLYGDRRSEQRFSPYPLLIGTAIALPGSGLRFDVPAENAFNPFGVALNRVQFRNSIAPRRFDEDIDTFHVVAGFDGTFDFVAREWRWDLSSAYTEREGATRTTGLLSPDRLRLGLGPSFFDAAGNATCGTPSAPVAGCVPINVFGGPSGFTQAMFDYAAVALTDTEHQGQLAHAATLRGSLVELPAGPLALDAGYEHRRESGFQTFDALRRPGAAFADGSVDVDDRLTIDEAHVALDVPLLANVTLARSLGAGVAARRVGFDARGSAHDSDTLFGANVDWQVDEHFGAHFAYAEGARVPSLTEAALSDDVVAPPDLLFPPLRLERARTTNVGVEWAARGDDGPVLALGWTRTRVRDPILFVTTGNTTETVSRYINVDSERTVESYDASATYGFSTPIGAIDLRFDGSYLAKDRVDTVQFTGRGVVGEYFDGEAALHRVRANAQGSWSRGDFAAHVGVRYRSGLDEDCGIPVSAGRPDLCTNPEGSRSFPLGETRLAATTYVDLQADWHAPWRATVSAGVRNLFDRDPPVSYSTESNFPLHLELPGRFFYVAYKQSF